MKKLLISFGGNYKLGYFGVISIHFRFSCKTKVQNGNGFLGDHKISSVFGVCLIFLFWGWGRGGKQ